jgi:DNA-directed RNA polymerase specialized sigma24 family protein
VAGKYTRSGLVTLTVRSPTCSSIAGEEATERTVTASVRKSEPASLYDTAAALLRDAHEAANAVQDTFVAAKHHLGQLRDPTRRLRAWLFAITRHEVERRGLRRQRAVPQPRWVTCRLCPLRTLAQSSNGPSWLPSYVRPRPASTSATSWY